MIVVHVFMPRFMVLLGLLLIHLVLPRSTLACKKQVKSLLNRSDEPEKSESDQECGVNLDEHKSLRNLPLFFSPIRSEFVLALPKKSNHDASKETIRWLSFSTPDSIIVSCPGSKIKVVDKEDGNLACSRIKGRYSLDGNDVTFEDLTCTRSIRESLKRTSSRCGPQASGQIVHIGWKVGLNDQFIPQISVCFNSNLAHTHYTNHTLYGKSVNARNTDAERPGYFKEGRGFYSEVSADRSYKLKTQETTFQELLGDVKGRELFDRRKSFFSRGHLAPDADFIFKEWQDATYYFFNVAPQWQIFNGGNWRAIEQAVRDYATVTQRNLNVYTGTLGNLAHKNDQGNMVKMYLGKKSGYSNFNLIPVPEFFWKIVHDPVSDDAIVFVGLNNPHFKGNPEIEEQLCPDVCASAKWFFFYQKDVSKGYSYCCSYQDFKGVIDWAPDIGDPGLLNNVLPVN